jgi:hypothetical protein
VTARGRTQLRADMAAAIARRPAQERAQPLSAAALGIEAVTHLVPDPEALPSRGGGMLAVSLARVRFLEGAAP